MFTISSNDTEYPYEVIMIDSILQGVILLAIAAGLYLAGYVFYDRLLSPLRNVPGPFLARFTSLWELHTIHKGGVNETFVKLHEKYGPVVRIGPNRYSFNSPEVTKTIYALQGGFAKSDWYIAGGPEEANLFTLQNMKEHAQRKRKIANLYTMTTMVNYEEAVDRMNSVLLRKFREFADAKKLVMIPEFLQYYAFDVIGEVTMDKSFGMMEAETDVTGLLKTIYALLWYMMYIGIFPSLHRVFLKAGKLLGKPPPTLVILKAIDEQVKRFRLHSAPEKENPKSEPFLSKLMTLETSGKVDLDSIIDSCGLNIIAGSDTTSITLSAAFYYVYRNPQVLRKLREEIDSKAREGKVSDPVTFHEAQDMPYLQAIISETLRIHPAVGQMLARVVPSQGAHLEGYNFPANTQVGVSAWALHYNEDVTPDARVFRPERWLEGDEKMSRTNNAVNFAFGGGARTCIGKNISLLEMTKVVPQIVRYFDLRFEKPHEPWELTAGWFVWQEYRCWIEPRKLVDA